MPSSGQAWVREGRLTATIVEAPITLFMATIEATEEAILNSLFHAETMVGRDGHEVTAMPVDEVLRIMEQRGYPVSR